MKRSALKADPEKTRAFVQRGRENAREKAWGREGMRSTELRAATAPSDFRDDDGRLLAPPPIKDSGVGFGEPKRRNQVTVPTGARRKALARSRGLCVVCLHREGVGLDLITPAALALLVRRGAVRKATTVHHVFPRQKWPALIKAAENLVGACFDCHMAHEYPGVKRTRIAFAALPACVIALADGDERMLAYLERTYAA